MVSFVLCTSRGEDFSVFLLRMEHSNVLCPLKPVICDMIIPYYRVQYYIVIEVVSILLFDSVFIIIFSYLIFCVRQFSIGNDSLSGAESSMCEYTALHMPSLNRLFT